MVSDLPSLMYVSHISTVRKYKHENKFVGLVQVVWFVICLCLSHVP